jgi:hypothetical protein
MSASRCERYQSCSSKPPETANWRVQNMLLKPSGPASGSGRILALDREIAEELLD